MALVNAEEDVVVGVEVDVAVGAEVDLWIEQSTMGDLKTFVSKPIGTR
jgi:hypothetical protein